MCNLKIYNNNEKVNIHDGCIMLRGGLKCINKKVVEKNDCEDLELEKKITEP